MRIVIKESCCNKIVSYDHIESKFVNLPKMYSTCIWVSNNHDCQALPYKSTPTLGSIS